MSVEKIGGSNHNGSENYYLDPEYYIFDDSRVKITLFILYSVVFFFCFFGNLAVVLVMTLHWKMRNISKFCIANLAWANLCVAIFCIYQNLTMFVVNNWIFGSFFCKMYHFITSLSSTASTFILVAISVERYMVILYPFKCRQILTMGRLRFIIIGIWIASGIICLPKLLYVILIHHKKVTREGTPNGVETICTISPNLFESQTSELIQFVLVFLLPMSIISILYYKVGAALREREAYSEAFVNSSIFEFEPTALKIVSSITSVRTERSPQRMENSKLTEHSNLCENCLKHVALHKKQSTWNCTHPKSKHLATTTILGSLWRTNCYSPEHMIFQTISPESIPCTSKLIRMNFSGSAVCCRECGFFCCHTKIVSPHRPHKDVVKLLSIIVFTFAFCNLPYHLRKIYQNYFYKPENESDLDELATPITFLLMYLNCAINPIVYAFMSKSFRACLCDLLTCRIQKPQRGWNLGKLL